MPGRGADLTTVHGHCLPCSDRVLTGKDLRGGSATKLPVADSSSAWTVHPGGHSEPADGQDVGGDPDDDQQVEDLVVAKDRQPDRGGRMKKVTSWAAIIAVPTGVTGFYGMNVPYPGFAQHRCMASSQLNSLTWT
jgi:hypothetical protein